MAFQELQEHVKIMRIPCKFTVKMAFQRLQEHMKLCEYNVKTEAKWPPQNPPEGPGETKTM